MELWSMQNWPRHVLRCVGWLQSKALGIASEIVILGMEHHLPTQYSCAAGELVAISTCSQA